MISKQESTLYSQPDYSWDKKNWPWLDFWLIGLKWLGWKADFDFLSKIARSMSSSVCKKDINIQLFTFITRHMVWKEMCWFRRALEKLDYHIYILKPWYLKHCFLICWLLNIHACMQIPPFDSTRFRPICHCSKNVNCDIYKRFYLL